MSLPAIRGQLGLTRPRYTLKCGGRNGRGPSAAQVPCDPLSLIDKVQTSESPFHYRMRSTETIDNSHLVDGRGGGDWNGTHHDGGTPRRCTRFIMGNVKCPRFQRNPLWSTDSASNLQLTVFVPIDVRHTHSALYNYTSPVYLVQFNDEGTTERTQGEGKKGPDEESKGYLFVHLRCSLACYSAPILTR